MPLGTLDRSPPPFFRQGPSALSKLTVFSALALFLMVADVRFTISKPLRTVLATAIYPLQWLVFKPVEWSRDASQYIETLTAAQADAGRVRLKLAQQSERASLVEQLSLENTRLRQLLALRERVSTPSQAAQVLYDAADPYTHKVIIDIGRLNGVSEGSPVIDESGVLGQVTRIYPSVSEVTLVIDRDQAIPVLNTRTGARGVAFGDAGAHSAALELRFMATNADVQAGDLLTTSGVDGVYPPGLPVARVEKVEQRTDSAFARIFCVPVGLVQGARHVMVLKPVGTQIPARPEAEPAAQTDSKKAKQK
ncbi:MAG: rod shape-determining protein MreC [Gammaproteobacteria bacterium]|nr:rod shape-determining protein MreC [Gammaproteobacteria bacterium]MBU0785831.1 rod shape-determining protein MreC [Gammaproteobacteria bacterium]MBU0815802.1 rod shape-determining protein MreC [Gammaproteobacteria bacterium]MBU1787341.1 rod shape-determining protein MreC [Gammaproteobacteria bacterium]